MMANINKSVRVRFAPSPTGPLHIGGVRTALFNWLFARQNGGKFILRIEDTDKERSDKKWEKEILEGLTWLGLNWDEEYRQSERTDIYKKYLEKLLVEDKAYYCYCTKEDLEAEKQAMQAQGLPPKYSGHCRNFKEPPTGKTPQVIRFKIPSAQVEFKDIIRGKVTFDASPFGDVIIAKDLNSVLYNFAVVVDDFEMKISHVIRGEEHLSNTPKQVLIQRALEFEEPEYAHLPLILNPDRSKMSKRFADTALAEYRKQGYLSEAIVNFLALLGWHPKGEKEIFALDELVKEFDLKRAQKAGAIFNQEKLDWLQREHTKNLTSDEIVAYLEPILKEKKVQTQKEFLRKIVELERPRLKTFNEFLNLIEFFFRLPDYDASLLTWQDQSVASAKSILKETLGAIAGVDKKDFGGNALVEAIASIVAKEGRGPVLWPLRVAVSGLRASPDPMEIMEALGKEESERRIEIAIDKLK